MVLFICIYQLAYMYFFFLNGPPVELVALGGMRAGRYGQGKHSLQD